MAVTALLVSQNSALLTSTASLQMQEQSEQLADKIQVKNCLERQQVKYDWGKLLEAFVYTPHIHVNCRSIILESSQGVCDSSKSSKCFKIDDIIHFQMAWSESIQIGGTLRREQRINVWVRKRERVRKIVSEIMATIGGL